ncbi:potassium channel family protein [Mesonia maritima]|uniref:Trk system potassium uptake protein TrkA n=1 Tax=Mesonia maritima TaxID=1793873 RepID=A0ABU1K259_9FLAO|nr:TrkA family potassium uptake protein [Mesonia maritima]MDR6299690.1 trk system potassium uptake protein TrkA [Mesonia maritima]
MKIVVIGLGNFGMSLAVHLADSGNEVIAADNNLEKIELIKEKVSHAVSMDATNENAYHSLPLKNTDVVIVAIGEHEGAALMSTAIVKKITEARIITRSASAIQDTILEAMDVDQIIHPEQEYAERLTKKINLKGSIDNFEIDDDYLVSEVSVCDSLIGKKLIESNFREKYKLNIITILRKKEYTNLIGRKSEKQEVIGMPKPDTVFQKRDVLVVFGKNSDIEKYLKNHANRSDN